MCAIPSFKKFVCTYLPWYIFTKKPTYVVHMFTCNFVGTKLKKPFKCHNFFKEVARGGERTRVLSISFIFSFFTTLPLSHSDSQMSQFCCGTYILAFSARRASKLDRLCGNDPMHM
jgi:hypothetical protein